MQQIKGIGCFACSHNNVPDQVKEKERGGVKTRCPQYLCLAASILIYHLGKWPSIGEAATSRKAWFSIAQAAGMG